MKSLEDFVKDSNDCDLRYELLEKWISRKEREIRQRRTIPPARSNKTDKIKYEEKEKKDSIRRKRALETVTRKPYNDITRDNLTQIVNKLCKRMYLFDGEYPLFIIDLVKEVLNHPNVTTTDKQVKFNCHNRYWKLMLNCSISTGKKV